MLHDFVVRVRKDIGFKIKLRMSILHCSLMNDGLHFTQKTIPSITTLSSTLQNKNGRSPKERHDLPSSA